MSKFAKRKTGIKLVMIKMKHLFVAMCVVLALCGCKKEARQVISTVNNVVPEVEQSTPESEKKTPAYLEQRVNSIYSKVFEEYNRANELEEMNSIPDPDSLYCSKDWNHWVQKVNEYDSENNADEIGFFEADYWVMGQDFGELKISDVKTISLNDRRAVVELNIHNFDDITRVRLDMSFEGNEWMIDDFTDMEHNYDWKKDMVAYMRGK
jgi:hypothetical protein